MPDAPLASPPVVRVRLPATFGARAGGRRVLQIEAHSIGESLETVTRQHPELTRLIWLNARALNPVIMVFHNETLVRDDSLDTPLASGDTVDVVPAVESG
jgi:molybdopterin converting factor small subunit